MSSFIELYEKEQTFVEYNKGDRVLSGVDGSKCITVQLPTVESFFGEKWDEAIKQIDGYGLPPHKQKYDHYRELGYYTMPPKLVSLREQILKKKKSKENERRLVYPDELFDEVESNPLEYKEEIDWMKVQIKRSIQGYWCFIKGRPTYIDGWHYTYLNFVRIGNEKRFDRLPFFRDVDRRIFLFLKWAYTTTESPYKYKLEYRKGSKFQTRYFNNLTNARWTLKQEGVFEGDFVITEGDFLVDKGYRTVYGVVFPKRRRVGATFMGSHVGTRLAIDNSLGTFAIQALTEETAKKDVFEGKVRAPMDEYPFFFKPTYREMADQIAFRPRKNVKLGEDIVPHGGWIIPRSSKNKAFDGNKLFGYLNDEAGKKEHSDILHEFRDTIKNALAQGDDIHGFAMYTSTFGEFEKGGGREYFDMCKKSIHHVRDDNGFTQTGLITLFIPADDGLDNYVDEFGYSVITDPDEPYRNMEGKIMDRGARSRIMNQRKFLEEMKDWSGLAASARNEPLDLKEAASPVIRSNFWDMTILRERITYLTYENTSLSYEIDLEWTEGRMTNVKVVLPESGKRGKWIVSYLPKEEECNKKAWDEVNRYWKPQTAYMGSFVLGTDPFYYNVQDLSGGKRKSNGGGAMFMCHDPLIDTPDKEEKVTERFVMTYNSRPDLVSEYCDDMLKAAVYFNAMVLTETNVPHILDMFREWGAGGYLMYMTDGEGNLAKTAGVRTTPEVKQKLFTMYGDHIKNNGKRERHVELLNEIMEIESFDDMTRYDLFAAGGMALLGSKSRYVEYIKEQDSESGDAWDVPMFD
jgi:hypothetical protein